MQVSRSNKIAIVGAGAAGALALIAALNKISVEYIDIHVDIYDSASRIGKSILKTGNGRCNFCNRYIDVEKYQNASFVKQILDKNSHLVDEKILKNYVCSKYSKLTLSSFLKLGLIWKENDEGRLYPYANKAESFLDVIDKELARFNNFSKYEECDIDEILSKYDNIILCTGSDNDIIHKFKAVRTDDFRGVLCPIEVQENFVSNLDNIRVFAKVDLIRAGKVIESEVGEVLFRKYGISGICIFNLSRYAMPGDILRLDLMPDLSQERFDRLIAPRLDDSEPFDEALSGVMLKPVARIAGKNLKTFELTVKGLHSDYQNVQVCRGGIDVSEVGETLRLKNFTGKNVYVAGEIIDVDGPCGGYNLNWAFSSGIIAGISAVSNIIKS